MRRLFTSESVTEGHPDKIADQISDAILDAIFAQDPAARVAVETFLTGNRVFLGGEVTTTAKVNYKQIVRRVILDIGYTDIDFGLDGNTCDIVVKIGEQSPDIAGGVDNSLEARTATQSLDDKFENQGAGDQGMMFGYATNETAAFMPVPVQIAHELAAQLAKVRKSGKLPYLRPDGKTQVTIAYENDIPVAIDTIVVSTQHEPYIEEASLKADIIRFVIRPVINKYKTLDKRGAKLLINPSGRFVIGGPTGDAGLTGRKIIVDTYGGMSRHGGGAFSGKDPSKVDRSAAYAMRWVARNIVAAGLAARCEVQISYAIGRAHPIALYVNTFGTGLMNDEDLAIAIENVFDLRPAAITHHLKLTNPKKTQYQPTAAYGHFGNAGRRGSGPTWEQNDKVAGLQKFAGEHGIDG